VRREPLLAALLCLVGAFVVLVGAGRGWAEVEVAAGPLTPARTLLVPGSELVPGLQALGLVGLAGVVAIAATRRWGRVVVGALLVLTGVGVLAAVLGTDVPREALRSDTVTGAGAAAGEAGRTAWPVVTALGGLVVAAAGLLTALRGRGWAGLGRRYDAPTARVAPERTGAAAERDLWEALDRGDDPTAAAPPAPADPGGSQAAPRD
jgi:uncharacterized membrane protein (TIGR02234 family)